MKPYLNILTFFIPFTPFVACSAYLLNHAKINGFEFFWFIVLSALISIILIKLDDINFLDFKNFRIKFNEIIKAKDIVLETEKKIRNISLRLAEIIAHNAQNDFYLSSNDQLIPHSQSSSKSEFLAKMELQSLKGAKLIYCKKEISDFLDFLDATDTERERVFEQETPDIWKENS